jgi:predicted lipid-binding transport protein (Tim44 family)
MGGRKNCGFARKASDMNGQIDLITLISLIILVVVVLKLRSVLGRRTGDEDSRLEQRYRTERRAQTGSQAREEDKVVTLPRRERAEAAMGGDTDVSVAEVEARIKTAAGADRDVERGLFDILKADPDFDPEPFLRGARQAYEMIVTAFAEGNRKTLKDLLSREVFDGFSAAVSERESKGEQIDQSFVGINKADIVEAEMKGGIANISVRFLSQLISATRDRGGNVISGDPQRIKEVTDIWTFSRDVSTTRARANPNWKLVATQSPN